MNITTRTRRALVAVVGAAGLALTATAATAAGPDTANPSSGGSAPDVAAVSALFPPGSEKQFVVVAPCRILDTRQSGGALVNGQRVFDATMGNYSTQGGKAGSCNIPDQAVAVQLNLGAISRNGTTSYVKGWATGTAEPLASVINFDPSGPVANMVTMPVNGSGQFTLKTPGAAHLFADVAGFYVSPLYVAVSPTGTVYGGVSSGLTSITKVSTGRYSIVFDRDVQRCAATASSITWGSNLDVSPDVNASSNANTVEVGIANPAGTSTDGYFTLRLSC
ncbi:hypothetical protein [Oryzobacter telluris]|uniref:hypothetical protein n=1 Tax=Oryzobacter telluris TaxID=3149179 RepID=UPI00370D6F4E